MHEFWYEAHEHKHTSKDDIKVIQDLETFPDDLIMI